MDRKYQTFSSGQASLRIRRRLLTWYARHKRDLPWRRSSDPYQIWISEVMLQQTRVSAVLPYYERFLQRFPHAQALADAGEQDLLAAWAGLGYYSRARNLQKAAKKIVELGAFPRDFAALLELPGVGEYTAAAVASIAFGLPHAVLDGNVARVLSRITAEPGDIQSDAVRKRLRHRADELLDRKQPGEFNQALMELGATVCKPQQPSCERCPLRQDCAAKRQGREWELPVRGARPIATLREKKLLLIEKADKILLWQRPAHSSRLAAFWELPENDQLPRAKVIDRAGSFRHTIVHTTYLVEVCRAKVRSSPGGFRWLAKSELGNLPVSTTAKKALALSGKPQNLASDTQKE
jgi:A/G-specific adenine glycosylase